MKSSFRNWVTFTIAVFFFISINSCEKEFALSNGQWDSAETAIDSLSFIVVGDWGRDGAYSQRSVADAMNDYSQKFHAQFIISTGDNFYPDGVSSINDPQWKSSFENMYSGEGLQIPWYPVLGNHDYMSNPSAEVLYSSTSHRWQMPSRYYSLGKQISGTDSALFVFTDTSPFVKAYYRGGLTDLPMQDTAAQMKWLSQTLSTSGLQWKIVVGHHPVYSVGKQHGNTPELIQQFKPLFNQTQTDFYICGHDHNLQYIAVPMDSVHYLVSGGGSENLPVDPNPYTVFARGTPGFLVMTLYPHKARFYFYNQRGELLYRKQVVKP
jgi:tartrate-resistant acid phosphatase type 5